MSSDISPVSKRLILPSVRNGRRYKITPVPIVALLPCESDGSAYATHLAKELWDSVDTLQDPNLVYWIPWTIHIDPRDYSFPEGVNPARYLSASWP